LIDHANAGLPAGVLRDLLTQGVLPEVGSVVVFLPQIVILFAFILVMEQSGYMARAAFIMDRLMATSASRAAASFRCCRASPARSRGSWRRERSPIPRIG
jgi:hypothetical protein